MIKHTNIILVVFWGIMLKKINLKEPFIKVDKNDVVQILAGKMIGELKNFNNFFGWKEEYTIFDTIYVYENPPQEGEIIEVYDIYYKVGSVNNDLGSYDERCFSIKLVPIYPFCKSEL